MRGPPLKPAAYTYAGGDFNFTEAPEDSTSGEPSTRSKAHGEAWLRFTDTFKLHEHRQHIHTYYKITDTFKLHEHRQHNHFTMHTHMSHLQGGQVKGKHGRGGAKFAGTHGVSKVHTLALKVARKHPRARYGQVDGRDHRPRPTSTQDFFKPRPPSQELKRVKRAVDGLPSKQTSTLTAPKKTQTTPVLFSSSGELPCGPFKEEV
jgi:hypothetical protein